MALDALISRLSEIAPPSDNLPTLCDLGNAVREFFSRADIQEWMVQTNQDNMYDRQENIYGQHIGYYSDKTAKHKRRKGLPDKYYTYYETGQTYESLRVYVEADYVAIWPDHESAPEYAHDLDASAWGLQPQDLDGKREEIVSAVIDQIRDFIHG